MMILVTGCAGFIGSHITERLLSEGHDVVGIDNFHPYYDRKLKEHNMSGFRDHKSFRFLEGSILDEKALDMAPKDIEVVNHQAAIAGVRNSMKLPLEYFQINVMGTLKLMEKFRHAKRFIFGSSSSVYGDVPENELPVKEDRPPNPISPYALSKLNAEQWCNMMSGMLGMKLVILRYFTVYGPRQRPDEAMGKFFRKVIRNEPIEVYGDGLQTRDFTYVGDVVQANMHAIERGSGVYNVASGSRISVNELISAIERVSGKTLDIRHIGKQAGDASHTWADIQKASSELGYSPKTGLEDGLSEQFKHVHSLGELASLK